jgi:hypothetical protein
MYVGALGLHSVTFYSQRWICFYYYKQEAKANRKFVVKKKKYIQTIFLFPEVSGSQAQDCQIFLGTWYQNPGKCTKWTQNVPNGHKISQTSLKYSKWPYNILAFSNLRVSKIYPNWDFWFENKPSGNPGLSGNWLSSETRQIRTTLLVLKNRKHELKSVSDLWTRANMYVCLWKQWGTFFISYIERRCKNFCDNLFSFKFSTPMRWFQVFSTWHCLQSKKPNATFAIS